jgi:putative pyruvate formate lyase activating enzyme
MGNIWVGLCSTGGFCMDRKLPNYVKLYRVGELKRRADEAVARLASCAFCAQVCEVNRLEGEVGVCRTGKLAVISSYGPHFGEERVLVGTSGSGTIFFANCNLSCVFCQNCDISADGSGTEVTSFELAEIMLRLQESGCHNINLVSPSHVVAQVLEALVLAVEKGLTLPLVYNTGGYDSLSTLELLDGVVDIYMPDFKFWDAATATRLARAKNYPRVARVAIYKMHRQVGDLVINKDGLAWRGLLLRHLVLPDGLSQTRQIMGFVAQKISPHTYVNVMGQYYPAYLAHRYPRLNRPLRQSEYRRAVAAARDEGLHRFAD